MKNCPRFRHPFLENIRFHQKVPQTLGGNSGNTGGNVPSGTVGGEGSSSPNQGLGGTSSGSSNGTSTLGGNSGVVASSSDTLGGANAGQNPPAPHRGPPENKPVKNTSEGSPAFRTREGNSSPFLPQAPSVSFHEAQGFHRNEMIRLHQDLQVLLSRSEPFVQVTYAERNLPQGRLESIFQSLGSLISQSISTLNRNPISLIQGALQGTLKNNAGSSLGTVASLLHSLGMTPAPVKTETSSQKIPPSTPIVHDGATNGVWNRSRQNFLGPLQAVLGSASLLSVSSANSALLKGLFQGIPLNTESEKALWSYFQGLAGARLKGEGLPFVVLGNAGVLRNFVQGLSLFSESFGLRWLQPVLSPLFRALFGGLLLKGGEANMSDLHSILLDELGALMARKKRRLKRKDRKRVNRADRVTAKDQSLSVDTHSQEKEGTIFIEEDENEFDSDEMMSLLWIPS